MPSASRCPGPTRFPATCFWRRSFSVRWLALRYQEHIRITVVTDLLPASAQRWAAVAADAISILVLLMIMGGAFNMMERTAGIFASTFDMSFSYLYLMQLVAAGLMALLLVEDLIVRLRGKPPTLPDEPKE